MQKVHSLWVYFTPEGVIENGPIFKSRTHTSGHFYIGVTTPPPPQGADPGGGPGGQDPPPPLLGDPQTS